MKKFLTACMIAAFVLGVGSPVQSATLEVRVPGGTGILGDVFTSIQQAIDAASNGDTITIHPGIYDEALNIEGFTGLTLVGTDKTGVIIKSSVTLPWNVGGYGITRQTMLRIVNSTGVVLQTMTLDCDLIKGNNRFGVTGWDSSVTIDNCILKNMSVDDLSGGYAELGTYFRAPGYTDGARAAITITDNEFINAGRVGVVTHDYIDADVSGNTFYKTLDDFGYAVEIGSQSTGSVTGNTIYGYDTPAATDGSESAGIYVENCFTGGSPSVTKNVTVSGNEIYGCQYAMWIGNGYDSYAGDVDIVVNVTGNNFHNNVDGAVILQDEDAEAGSSVTAVFQNNTVTDNNSYGYHIFTQGDGSITASFTDETITGHAIGITVDDFGAASSSSYSIQVRNSNLSGNTAYGIDNTVSTFVVDAIENCWGDASGPYHPVTNTGGLGSAVSDNVDYYPWYLDCSFTTPAYKPVHNVTINAYYDTIQGAIDEASDGDEITADPITYNESVVIDVDNLTLTGIEGSKPAITGGLRLDTDLAGLTLENFIISGTVAASPNSVVRMYGAITDLTIDNCVFDGENVSGRLGFSGGQLEGDVTITNCEFKQVLGWALLDSRSGSGGDGSAMGTVTFAGNNIHHCNGSIVFRGLSSDRTDVVNAYGNTWSNIGGNAGETGQHWAALEINRAVAANVYGNAIGGVTEGEWGEGQALQLWDIDTLDVYDNTLTGNFQGIYVHGSDPAYGGSLAVPGGAIYCNTISGNSDYGISVDPSATGGPLNAELNWWGDASGPSGSGGGTGDAVSDNVGFFPWLLSTDCNDLTEVVADYVVDDDWEGLPDWSTVTVGGADYYIGLNAFDTIQKAVDAASDGNSIRVLEGEYVGAVMNEDLTITGANPGGSVITSGVPYKAGSGLETAFRLDGDADGASISSFTVDCNRDNNFFFAVFARAADDVTIDSLTVNKPVQGISVYGANDCKITNNVLNETEAAGGGGIAIYIAARPPDYPVLQRNLVKNNVVTAAATAPDFTCPGIAMCLDLRYGGYGDLTGSEDLSYNKISNNTIMANYTDNEVGIEMGVIIAEDEPNRPDKVAAMLGKIHDNQIRNNIIDGANLGVYVYTVADLMVLGNELTDCNEGVHMEDVHRGVAIGYNAIYGSATYGVNNATGTVVDATYNWWGDVSGPADPCGTSETDGVDCHDVSTVKNADGLGDAVTADVEYCPWLVAPPSSSDNPLPAGDLNFDGCINWLDLAALADGWLDGCEE